MTDKFILNRTFDGITAKNIVAGNAELSVKCNGQNNTIAIEGNQFKDNFKGFDIEILGSNNTVKIDGLDCFEQSKSSLFVKGDNNILSVGRGKHLRGVRFIIRGFENRIQVSEQCSSNFAGINAVGRNVEVVLGKDCMLSGSIMITTTDEHSITDLDGNLVNPDKSVYIGNHVWLGYDVSVMKGAYIDDNCVVGRKSVVTKNFSNNPNCILAGVPARIVKHGINWDRCTPYFYRN